MLEAQSRKASHIQEGCARQRQEQARQRTKGSKGQQTQQDKRTRTRTRTTSQLFVGIGQRGHYSKSGGSKQDQTNRGRSKGMNKNRNTTDAHNLDLTKPANSEPKVEVGGWDMSYFSVGLRVRGVQAPVCTPLLSVGEYTTVGGAAVKYGDKR